MEYKTISATWASTSNSPPIHLQIHLQSIREVCRTVLLETLCVWFVYWCSLYSGGLFDRRMERRALLPKGELYCREESSIAKRRTLLQRGKLYCGALYSRKHLAYCASTISGFNATSMKTRKLSFHHHDTTLHDYSVLPKIEELLIPIGFWRGVESRTRFY